MARSAQSASFQRFLEFCPWCDTPVGHEFGHPPTTTLVLSFIAFTLAIQSTLPFGCVKREERQKTSHTKRDNERIIMAQYQVDSEQIQSSSAAVNASIQAIRQSVQGMYANLNNLQSVWRGGAATQFNAVAEQWRAAQQQMEQSLESIQHALSQASMLYSETEMQASRLFAQ